ncbi:hypothetical protein JG688_00016303 [Phytophthora aleatoria]|uniref:RxLR effector protein n=1 Tax=Phytophthora aleatoria TaxID=2496075 RepID=A0A8J5IYE7_9STRA|nr:hypothetical protein JG688_00016303 [Phytophthora aleatoria]
MVLSAVGKDFALLALLALDVTCADPSPSRQLRSGAKIDLPPSRKLQGKFGWAGWLAIAKTNMRYQPTGDRFVDYLRQMKEKLQRTDG